MIFPCPSSLKRRCKMACDCCLFKFLCSVKGKHVSRYKRKTFVFKFLQWVGPMTKINKSLRYLYYQCNVLRVWAGYYSPADTVHVPGTVPNNPGRPLLTFSSSFNAYFLKELIFFLSIFFSFFIVVKNVGCVLTVSQFLNKIACMKFTVSFQFESLLNFFQSCYKTLKKTI